MPPPSSLTIAAQSVQRLVKEETYYHKEQAQQEERIKKLQQEIETNNPDLDSNAEYVLRQEVCGVVCQQTHFHCQLTPYLIIANRSRRDQKGLRAPGRAHR